MQMTRNTCEQQ